ncbi:MAG TPA: IS1634 family transposase, partial [Streptosporangiaceae bacterium]
MSTSGSAPFTLASRRLGALPLVAHFARRMGLPGLLDRWVPPDDARLALDPATVLGAVIANLCLEHRPLYALGEWAAQSEPGLLGLAGGQAGLLNDDRAGRMLDRLFAAGRGSLLTELMAGVIGEFGIDCSRLHNDSTSVSVHGACQAAGGGQGAGLPTAAVTFGHSKDHRPDLKQLVFILTVSGDHAVPVICRLADGNTGDDPAHVPTWDTLVKLTGGPDFLYVADCKLASEEAMSHLHRGGGRFITVLPRGRKEDAAFRAWLQDRRPAWTEAARAPGARIGEPDQVWSTCEAPWPSAGGYRIVWVHDSGKQLRDAAARARQIASGVKAIEEDLAARLSSPRTRLRTATTVHAAARGALARAHASRWVRYAVTGKTDVSRKQAGPGRPGPNTSYRKIEKTTFQVTCDIDYDQVARDAASDGCWPLITNDPDMTGAAILAAYRYQPNLERRHHLLKGIQDAAPLWIKTIPRIEAIFLCHFIAPLICALIERQIRTAMKTAQIAKIPLYPELRGCAAPSAARIFEIFAHLARHELRDSTETLIQAFEPQLTGLQQQILELLGIPATA